MYKYKKTIIKKRKIFYLKTIYKNMFSGVIDKIIKENNVYFCMPGNKYSEKILKYRTNSFFDYDLTELSFSDNLLNAKGIIKNLEEKVRKFYNCKKALIFTNGATSAIMTAIFSINDNAIIIGENHKSIYNSLMVKKTKTISFTSIESFFNEEKKQKAKIKKNDYIIVTAPNYFGENGNIEKLYKYCRINNIILLIDASHSAHYGMEGLPKLLSDKADFVIVSLHKTLPVLTGGAVLCINNINLIEKAIFYREVFHTSSPSYPIMYSIDKAIDFISKSKNVYLDVIDKIEDFKKSLHFKYKFLDNNDKTRLVIVTNKAKIIAKFIEKQHKIFCEMTSCEKIVFIITPFNYKYLSNLKTALEDKKLSKIIEKKSSNYYINEKTKKLKKKLTDKTIKIVKKVVLKKENINKGIKKNKDFENIVDENTNSKNINNGIKKNKEFENIVDENINLKSNINGKFKNINNVLGLRIKGNLSIYPPGIPFLKDGEIIENKHIEIIKKNKKDILGLVNNKIYVYCDK